MDKTEDQHASIRVLTVDDHEIVRQGMAFLLLPFEDIDVVGSAGNGSEALAMCKELKPDVVLMDMVMPEMDGPTVTQAIRKRFPNVQVLVLTSFHDQAKVARAMQAGAIGYLLKGVSIDELADGIRSAYAGKPVMAPEAMQAIVRASQAGQAVADDLSERELEVLALLVQGKTNREIAEELLISLPTVKTHLRNIYGKLGAANRAEAASLAIRHGLISDI